MLYIAPVLPTVREESAPNDPDIATGGDIATEVNASPQHSRRFPIGSIAEQCPTCLNEVLASDLIGTDPGSVNLRTALPRHNTYIDSAMSTTGSFQMIHPPASWDCTSVTSDFIATNTPIRPF